ncbi:MAG: Ig-like domain-containing protein [Eubacteriales bacterium]|nr:Ig-like domain-containing protein [Eubacteriales bacterium]
MNRTKWIRAFAVFFSLAFALIMLGIPNIALATVDTVAIIASGSTTILVGDQLTLSASVNASSGSALNNPVYSWTPTAAGILTMTPTNSTPTTVTGRTAGKQTVTLAVHDDNTTTDVTGTIEITVNPMTVAPTSATLAIGGTTTIVPDHYTGTVVFGSSNTSVATVDPTSGVVTAVASGTATITATNTPANSMPTQTATSSITVVAPTVTLNPPSQTLTNGSATTTLTLSVTNGGTVIPNGATVNWGNSDLGIGALSSTTSSVSSGVATINFTSSLAATNGTATITATVGGISRTATITVSTVKHLDIVGPSDLNKTTRTGTYTVYLKNPDGTVYDDDTSTVHWSWSSSYLSLTSDSINDHRADMHNGEAHIQLYAKYNTPSAGTRLYAWINSDTGNKEYHTINISGLSSLPQTGQDMTLVYVFGGLSAALLAAAGVWYGIRKKNTAA